MVKDLIKIVPDIKIVWGRDSFSQARGKSKEMCKFGQHFEVVLIKVNVRFCGLTNEPTSTGTLTYQEKMVEKTTEERACCVQLTFPIITASQSHHLFALSQVPRTPGQT